MGDSRLPVCALYKNWSLCYRMSGKLTENHWQFLSCIYFCYPCLTLQLSYIGYFSFFNYIYFSKVILLMYTESGFTSSINFWRENVGSKPNQCTSINFVNLVEQVLLTAQTKLFLNASICMLIGLYKSVNTSILKHLVNSGHSVSWESPFKIIYTVTSTSSGLQIKKLHLIKDLTLHQFKPNLKS